MQIFHNTNSSKCTLHSSGLPKIENYSWYVTGCTGEEGSCIIFVEVHTIQQYVRLHIHNTVTLGQKNFPNPMLYPCRLMLNASVTIAINLTPLLLSSRCLADYRIASSKNLRIPSISRCQQTRKIFEKYSDAEKSPRKHDAIKICQKVEKLMTSE